MDIQKRINLVKILRKKTDDGKLIWEKTIGNNAYQVILANSSIKIIEDSDRYDNASYSLAITNSDGDVTEVIYEYTLSEESPEMINILREIYNKARAIALNAEGTLDNIIDALK